MPVLLIKRDVPSIKKPGKPGLFIRITADQAIALIAADSRLLWRAALFLWMIPLSAMQSIVPMDAWNAACATALSADSIPFLTCLIAVRNSERRLVLRTR